MDHLKNFLLGIGDVLTAFGTAPNYKYPGMGDRAIDNQKMRRDMAAVSADMNIAAARVVRGTNVKIEDSATER